MNVTTTNTFSQIDQRRFELLESRFVPLNQQKSISQDVSSNQSIASDDQNRISSSDIQFLIEQVRPYYIIFTIHSVSD